MGVGYPDEIEQYARMGVDMMDCVLPPAPAATACCSPAKAASTSRPNATPKTNHRPTPPAMPVCRRYTRAYLRHLMQAGEALSAILNTIHNLAYYLESWNASARASSAAI